MLFGGLQIRGLFSGLAKNMGYRCWDSPLAWHWHYLWNQPCRNKGTLTVDTEQL